MAEISYPDELPEDDQQEEVRRPQEVTSTSQSKSPSMEATLSTANFARTIDVASLARSMEATLSTANFARTIDVASLARSMEATLSTANFARTIDVASLARSMEATLSTANFARTIDVASLARSMEATLSTANFARTIDVASLARSMEATLSTANFARTIDMASLARSMEATLSTANFARTIDVASLARSMEATLAALEGISFPAGLQPADVLRQESAELISDPAGWFADIADAARSGVESAKHALFLAQYLFGCFLLFARRLDPSAKTIERFGPIIALSVLLVVAGGVVEAKDPKLIEKINDRLSTPLGLLGVFLGVVGGTQTVSRAKRHKPSKPRRGSSKPRRKVIRRYLR
ncbi:hypothetical protein GA0070616_1432 [Micromonospora nigra]|uniref:Uncharacterized protein n=2 Tax=Micromonospora nigra TaxID=145857 RepID=A0A1C6RLQ7_9ACTN|nr:hypothetical protein GA0070616_1432 [Micromonospora nigra]